MKRFTIFFLLIILCNRVIAQYKLSDNLGNHTAIKSLNLNGNKIVGVVALSNTTADTIVLLIGGELKKISFSNFLTLLPAQTNSDWNASTGVASILNKPTKLSQFTNDLNYLTSNQSISVNGDASGSGTISLPLTLNTVNSNVFASNAFLKFAVNGKGLITSAAAVGVSDITTALGYTPLSGNQNITLTGDITGSGATSITTTYNNVVPSNKGGAGTISGLLKANGSGTVSAAVAGADYQAALTNPITGTGANGQVAIFNGATTQTSYSNFTYNTSTNSLTLNNVTAVPYASASTNDAIKFVNSSLGATVGVQNNNISGFSGIEYLNTSGSIMVFTGYQNSTNEFRINNIAAGGYIDFKINGTSSLRVFNNRSVSIGTTTDNGAGVLQTGGNIVPSTNNSYTNGASSYRWSTIYGVNGDFSGTTKLGTVSSGTWNGSVIGSTYGGAGSISGLLKANGSGTVSAAVAGTDYQAPITLTTTGSIGAATLSGNTLNIPVYAPNRTPNIVATRPVDGTSFRVSTTRDADVRYSVQINGTSASSSGTVYLEYSSDNSTWSTIGQVGFNLSLFIGSSAQTFQIVGYVPANYWVRLRSVTSSTSVSFMNGQEILY